MDISRPLLSRQTGHFPTFSGPSDIWGHHTIFPSASGYPCGRTAAVRPSAPGTPGPVRPDGSYPAGLTSCHSAPAVRGGTTRGKDRWVAEEFGRVLEPHGGGRIPRRLGPSGLSRSMSKALGATAAAFSGRALPDLEDTAAHSAAVAPGTRRWTLACRRSARTAGRRQGALVRTGSAATCLRRGSSARTLPRRCFPSGIC